VPSLVEARTLIDQFHDMIRKNDEAKLDAWIANAKASLVSSFATGVLRDIAAVRAQSRSLGQTARSKADYEPHTRQTTNVWALKN
jgi:ribosomal protein S20